MKVLFSGGGTAGHILPIIAIVRELRRKGFGFEFFYIGPKDEFGSILLSQEGVHIKTILAGKIRRYLELKAILENIIDVLFKIPLGFLQSFFYLFFLAPDLIFSKGGYGSLSPCLSAKLLQVPIFLHESDLAPGFCNRFLSGFALEIFVSFSVSRTEYFSPRKMVSVGNPIRKEILEGSTEEAKKIFNLTGEKPVILVMGGSQGAQKINDLILAIMPNILNDFELIHQTGERNFKGVQAESKVVIPENLRKYYHLLPFLKEIELKHAYQIAEVIVTRAGSGTIFEIAALGKPSILIPLSISAQAHQLKNAYAYAESGAAIVLEEANLTPNFFLEKLKFLISWPEEGEKMEKAAREFSRPRSAEIIAQYLGEYLTQ